MISMKRDTMPPYWPCRQKALQKLDKLFLASEDARNYMMKKF